MLIIGGQTYMLTYKEFIDFLVSKGKQSIADCWDEKRYIWMISRLETSKALELIHGMVA